MAVIAQFQPLDRGIVSDEIPAFSSAATRRVFGCPRRQTGDRWNFLLQNSAVSFAKAE